MITRIGRHRVRHGDVMDDLSQLIAPNSADLIYTDPPWGQGNLRYWRTMNKKATGQVSPDHKLDDFLHRVLSLSVTTVKPSGIIVIEYGQRWEGAVIDKMRRLGQVLRAKATPVYSSENRPLSLLVFSQSDLWLPPGYVKSINGTKGYKTLQAVAAPFDLRGKVVFDPCCGMGYSARLAVDNDAIFVGNELNSKRLRKTVERLKR